MREPHSGHLHRTVFSVFSQSAFPLPAFLAITRLLSQRGTTSITNLPIHVQLTLARVRRKRRRMNTWELNNLSIRDQLVFLLGFGWGVLFRRAGTESTVNSICKRPGLKTVSITCTVLPLTNKGGCN